MSWVVPSASNKVFVLTKDMTLNRWQDWVDIVKSRHAEEAWLVLRVHSHHLDIIFHVQVHEHIVCKMALPLPVPLETACGTRIIGIISISVNPLPYHRCHVIRGPIRAIIIKIERTLTVA